MDKLNDAMMGRPMLLLCTGSDSDYHVLYAARWGKEQCGVLQRGLRRRKHRFGSGGTGIGTCHIWGAIQALNENQELLKELNLPEGYVPCGAVILGHTDEIYELQKIPMDRIRTNYLA